MYNSLINDLKILNEINLGRIDNLIWLNGLMDAEQPVTVNDIKLKDETTATKTVVRDTLKRLTKVDDPIVIHYGNGHYGLSERANKYIDRLELSPTQVIDISNIVNHYGACFFRYLLPLLELHELGGTSTVPGLRESLEETYGIRLYTQQIQKIMAVPTAKHVQKVDLIEPVGGAIRRNVPITISKNGKALLAELFAYLTPNGNAIAA